MRTLENMGIQTFKILLHRSIYNFKKLANLCKRLANIIYSIHIPMEKFIGTNPDTIEHFYSDKNISQK